jgi:hypothetical protein
VEFDRSISLDNGYLLALKWKGIHGYYNSLCIIINWLGCRSNQNL